VAIKNPLDHALFKEGDEIFFEGTAKDSDKGDTLQYDWLDNDHNGPQIARGRNVSCAKLTHGVHNIILEVSDGTETVSTIVTIVVEKKETVTVSSGDNGWLSMTAAAAAVFAIVAVVAVLAVRRRKRPEEPEPSGEGRVASVPEGEGIALPSVPPAEAGAGDEKTGAEGEEARNVIDSTVDKLADYQEAHPEDALDFTPVMEKLDIARDMLKSGENDDALDFAREAEAAADKMTAKEAPAAPKRTPVKRKVSAIRGRR